VLSAPAAAAADKDERPMSHLLNDVILYRVSNNAAVTLIASKNLRAGRGRPSGDIDG